MYDERVDDKWSECDGKGMLRWFEEKRIGMGEGELIGECGE